LQQTYAFAVPNELDQMLGELGGTGINAFTSYDETVYHNTFPASQIDTWLQIYAHRFEDPVFRLFPTELEAVYEEKNSAMDTTGYELFRTFMRGAFPGHPYGRNDILGEVEHLKRPSLRVMKEYFDRWYVPGNMALVLSGDLDVGADPPAHRGLVRRVEARPRPANPTAHPSSRSPSTSACAPAPRRSASAPSPSAPRPSRTPTTPPCCSPAAC
jgi:zinc protease